jgi:hypothetical protein
MAGDETALAGSTDVRRSQPCPDDATNDARSNQSWQGAPLHVHAFGELEVRSSVQASPLTRGQVTGRERTALMTGSFSVGDLVTIRDEPWFNRGEIADILGYANHSAVSERLTYIRAEAQRFFDHS